LDERNSHETDDVSGSESDVHDRRLRRSPGMDVSDAIALGEYLRDLRARRLVAK